MSQNHRGACRFTGTWLPPEEYDALTSFCKEYGLAKSVAIKVAVAAMLRETNRK